MKRVHLDCRSPPTGFLIIQPLWCHKKCHQTGHYLTVVAEEPQKSRESCFKTTPGQTYFQHRDWSEIPIPLAHSQASGTGSLFPWLNEPAEEFPLHPKRLFETWKALFQTKLFQKSGSSLTDRRIGKSWVGRSKRKSKMQRTFRPTLQGAKHLPSGHSPRH